MLGEIIIRGILALLVVNLFIYGIYLSTRGFFINYALKHSCVRKNATLTRITRTTRRRRLFCMFSAKLSWNYRGEIISAVEPHLFSIKKTDRVVIFLFPNGYQYKLDSWSQNGKGLIGTGLILCLIALILFVVLV